MADEEREANQGRTTLFAFPELVSTAASTIVVATAVAYVVGWVHARAYFSQFGAAWLAGELSPFQLLQFSWLPLSTLLVFSFMRIHDEMERQEAGGIKRTSRGRTAVGLAVLIALFVAALVLQRYHHPQAAYFVGSSLGIFFAVYVGSALRDLFFVSRGARPSRLSILTGLGYGILFFGIYFVPRLMGEVQGKFDSDPDTSELPRVQLLAPAPLDLRLVTVTEQVFYVAVLSKNTGRYPSLRPIERSQVAAVQMGKP